jgi:hypothetical protein
MLIATKEIGRLLVSVLRVILATLMSPVDQNALLTANVRQQNLAKTTNATILAPVSAGLMLNVKS